MTVCSSVAASSRLPTYALEALQARYEAAMARERLETDSMKGIVPPRIYDRDDGEQAAADEALGADR